MEKETDIMERELVCQHPGLINGPEKRKTGSTLSIKAKKKKSKTE